MKPHKKRTKFEKISILSIKKVEKEKLLIKIQKETDKLKKRIYRKKANGMNTKFLEKILSERIKATHSVQKKLKSIEQELNILIKSPGPNGLSFFLSFFYGKTYKKL